ncbi:TOX high mobility group box family member 2 isoform X6 [Homo sapiens]|uniref:TOX high mobility group box family member 2 isoform X6 n=1 Tax=Homo sapiens TaxID=9606 RepID=UPI000387D3CA|nr:TOX high mobility group box family member 2 isoform X6 [Homo sapiens]XP_054180137.1 TOX high mobility group box family member 2 isoform X6 [Homo sapiens]
MQQTRTEAVAGAFSRCLGFCGMRLGLLLLARHWCIAGVFPQKFDGDSAYVGMSDGNPELLSTSQTYNGQSENNEDYEIPPITPPNLPEPSLLHLGDHEASYHSLCHGLTPNGLLPAYSYQAMDLPAIMVSNMLAQDSHLLSGQLPTIQEMVHSEVAAYDSGRPGPLLGRPAMLASHMSALSQSQLISQMGIRSSIAHSSPSPPGSKSATPSPSSSTQEEESEVHFKISGEKRPSADPGKKAKNPKKKKKKDPNEPQKPVSAYALFFRDTQAAIKGQNPSATFGDVSKIVASMWDSLGEEQKQDFPHISEFPSSSGSCSPGPSNPTSSGDWDSSYPSGECGISTCSLLPRDKSLYLT